ncbi:MAG: UDP-N-acetylmuramate--L-alanine ligase [Gemmatimonadota bacterium]|nr:UDP-N-acetylmuramate--L-alanine ligase [Gemmatimonadota bacterium]
MTPRLPAAGAAVHLVGAGGAGMRGLAVLLDHRGYRVTGCDRAPDRLTDLRDRGIRVETGHDAAHVEGMAAVIRSSAVPPDSPEIRAAVDAGIPVLRRAAALGAALNGGPLAGIAGTHGKTTITAMTGYACEAAGLDPTVMVGGHVGVWGGFARTGAGPAIVEADEYDRSFLELHPTVALVSSLEAEHLDIYGDFEGVRSAFTEFAGRADGGAGLIYCTDDEGARALGESLPGARAYGFDAGADYRIGSVSAPTGWRVEWADGAVDLHLRVHGRHNAQNAAGALAVAMALGADPVEAARGLASFPGVGRRLEILAIGGRLTIVDDYAHHPTEVAASIEALRAAFPGAFLEVVFQPHLYTRTRDFAAEFAVALAAADRAHVLPIYPAREEPIEGVSSALITVGAADHVAPIDRDAALALVEGPPPDASRVVAYMGAGDVTGIAHEAAGRAAGRRSE